MLQSPTKSTNRRQLPAHSLTPGDRVELINDGRRGHLAYLGPVEGQASHAVWAGIILDTADGLNDGSVNG